MICKACKNEISDKVRRCPYCGQRTRRLFESINSSLISSLLILTITIFIVIMSTMISNNIFSDESVTVIILMIVGIFLVPILGSIILSIFTFLDVLIIMRVIENFKSWKTFTKKVKAKLIISLTSASLSLISAIGFIIWFIIKWISH